MALLGAYQRRTLLWASGLHLCLRKLLSSGGLISLFVLSVWECTHICSSVLSGAGLRLSPSWKHSIPFFLAWLPIAWQALSSGHPTVLQKTTSGVSRFKTQNQKIGCSLSRSGINSTQEALPFTTWLRGERGIQRLLRGIIWVG